MKRHVIAALIVLAAFSAIPSVAQACETGYLPTKLNALKVLAGQSEGEWRGEWRGRETANAFCTKIFESEHVETSGEHRHSLTINVTPYNSGPDEYFKAGVISPWRLGGAIHVPAFVATAESRESSPSTWTITSVSMRELSEYVRYTGSDPYNCLQKHWTQGVAGSGSVEAIPYATQELKISVHEFQRVTGALFEEPTGPEGNDCKNAPPEEWDAGRFLDGQVGFEAQTPFEVQDEFTMPLPTLVGLNAEADSKVRPEMYADVKPVAQVVRLENNAGFNNAAAEVKEWWKNGVKSIVVFNPNKSGGVAELPKQAFVNEVTEFDNAHPEVYADEILNEPWETGFPCCWGPGAENETNRKAYAELVKAVETGMKTLPAAKRVPIVAAMKGATEGGEPGHGEDEWDKWYSQDFTEPEERRELAGVTVHPYTGNDHTEPWSSSTGGGEPRVKSVWNTTHTPVYVTELGWPTSGSLSVSKEHQAKYIEEAIAWFDGEGASNYGVKAVTIFSWRDSPESTAANSYGLETAEGTEKKPSYGVMKAIKEAAVREHGE